MSRDISKYKVALVTDSLWKMAGANRVLEAFAEMFPSSDIYALFGEKKNLSEELLKHKITFSFLNKIPFIGNLYRYTFHLWPIAIEQIDLSGYDIVISNSSSVAHGVITPLDCKHFVYLNSPMRYAWDQSFLYKEVVKFDPIRESVKNILVHFNRTWDVVAAQRAENIVANSYFVKKRAKKYWRREIKEVVHPPVECYKGTTVKRRKNYFVSGAPFEPNKRGDFLLECARIQGFNLKLIGEGSMLKKLKRKYSRYGNIEFLGWVSQEEKWELLSEAEGFLVSGVEDYGIFCAEAISCGTPVLAYMGGGSLEIVKGGLSGMFFERWDLDSFEKAMGKFRSKRWDYDFVRAYSKAVNDENNFKKKMMKLLVE